VNRVRRQTRTACIAFVAASAVLSASAGSAGCDPAEVLRCVQARYGALRDLTAAFTRRAGGQPRPHRTRAGDFFSRPRTDALEYDKPDPS